MTFSLTSLPAGAHVHFIGIGGISMSGLADILINRGYIVSGSDMRESKITEYLKSKGAEIYIGQCAANIKNSDVVVYTAAIKPDCEELIAAKESGALVFDRATLMGSIMKLYKYPVAVAGTHGKTTTTSMMTHIALAADLDPTISIGGELPAIGGNIRVGNGEYFICEACEYHQSFLRFFPLVSIILNIEEDHLDYFRGLDHIKDTFRALADLTPAEGAVVINADDANTVSAVSGTQAKVISCKTSGNADYTARDIWVQENGCAAFTVLEHGTSLGTVSLSVPGMHNISNALCAVAATRFLGLDFSVIQKGLASFTGVGRRFERKGKKDGVTVIDDYAHHPTEISATLRTAKGCTSGKVWCVFQPHTYTRTKTLFPDFVEALSGSSPLVLDIYAAREKDTGLISSKDLAEAIPDAVYLPSFADCLEYLRQNAKEGDMLLTMGAGDVYRIGELFLENK